MPAADEARAKRLDDRTVATGGAAKWLIAGLAAIGAALLTGLQAAKLGGIDEPERVFAAAVGGVCAIGGVVVAALLTVRVLLPANVSLEDIVTRDAMHPDEWLKLERVRLLRDENDTPTKFLKAYQEALDARREALDVYYDDPTKNRSEAVRTSEEAARLNLTAWLLVSEMRERETAANFAAARRWLPWLALLLALSVLALTWALNGPARPAVDLRGAALTSGVLTGAELRGARLDGLKIENVDLKGTYLVGATMKGTTWKNVRCPDGVNSDVAGNTCAGHLKP